MRSFTRVLCVALLSLPLSCGDDKSTQPEGDGTVKTPLEGLKARDHIRRTFFFLDNPNRVRFQNGDSTLAPIPLQSTDIRLYRDDSNSWNNDAQGAAPVTVTPTGRAPCDCPDAHPADCDSTSMEADVWQLQPGMDYVIHLGEAGHFAFNGTVIELLQPLGDEEILAAAYIADLDGDYVPDTVGTWNPRSDLPDGEPCRYTFKMIAPPRRVLTNRDLTEGGWNAAHNLECRNFYRLGAPDIPEGSLDLRIVWDAPGESRPSDYQGVPYIAITGLDLFKESGGAVESGQDGKVDSRCLDLSRGILHFPQLRPFAPDYFDRTYRRDGSWPEMQLASDPDSTGAGNFWEPAIYDSFSTVFRMAGDTHVDRYLFEGEH